MIKIYFFLSKTVGFYHTSVIIVLGMMVALFESFGLIGLFTNRLEHFPFMDNSSMSVLILIFGIMINVSLKIYLEKLTWKNNSKISETLLRHSITVTKLNQDPSIIAKDALAESQNIAVNVLSPCLNIFSRIAYLSIFLIIFIISGVFNKYVLVIAIVALLLVSCFSLGSRSLSEPRSKFLSARYVSALNIINARREIIQSGYEKPFLEFQTAIKGFSRVLFQFRILQYGLRPSLELLFLLLVLFIILKNDFSLPQVQNLITANVVYFPILLRLLPTVFDIINSVNKILYSSKNIDTFIQFNDTADLSFGINKHDCSVDQNLTVNWQIRLDGFKVSDDVKETSLVISEGNLIQLKGPSGVGKSSLIESVFLTGNMPENCKVELSVLPGSAKPSCFYSPQFTRIFNGTIQENIILQGDADYFQEFCEKIESIEDPFILKNLQKQINSSDHGLSGGEIQRIGILRALYSRADIMIFDEPFSALDEAIAQKYESFIREFCRSVMIVSHTNLSDEFTTCVMKYV